MGDNSPADPARFCPPVIPTERGGETVYADGRPTGECIGALVEWLWRITPPGAPLVPILDVPHAPGPGCVPFIRERFPLEGRPPTWPRRARDEQLVALVPAGLKRPRRGQGSPRPRDGHDRWRMEAAYFRDLYAEDEEQVANRLDLSFDGDLNRGTRSRSARRYVGAGRKLLSGLGAWPWCLDASGQLGAQWWTERRYAVALAAWHFRAFADGLDELLRPVQWAAGDRPQWRVVDYKLAARLYGEQFPQLVERAA